MVDIANAKLWEKDALQIGVVYTHPRDGWTLNVTPEWARELADMVDAMADNGVDMPILTKHNFDEKPPIEDVLGYVRGANISGGWLRLLCAFKGDDAEKTARGVDRVSAGLERSLVDGQGRRYSPALSHLAVTPFPIVDGQDGFLRVAASRGVADAALCCFTMVL